MTLIADVFWKLGAPKYMLRSIPKKSRFRESVEKGHGKCAQTLLQIEGEPIYHIYGSLETQLSYKKSLLVISKISKLFPNTLSADGKYSLLIETIERNQFIWNYLENKKLFFNFFLDFRNKV